MYLLFNRSIDFPIELNSEAKLSNMSINSQPLLRIKNISPLMTLKTYTLIELSYSKFRNDFKGILSDFDYFIEIENRYILGLATLKNDFSSFMIDEVSDWNKKVGLSKFDQSK